MLYDKLGYLSNAIHQSSLISGYLDISDGIAALLYDAHFTDVVKQFYQPSVVSYKKKLIIYCYYLVSIILFRKQTYVYKQFVYDSYYVISLDLFQMMAFNCNFLGAKYVNIQMLA